MTSGVCDIHAVMHVRIFSTTRLRITNLSIKSEKNLSATCMYKLEYSIIHMYEQIPCCF